MTHLKKQQNRNLQNDGDVAQFLPQLGNHSEKTTKFGKKIRFLIIGIRPEQPNLQGRGAGLVVRLLAFYSDDLSLNPGKVNSYNDVKLFKNENKQKRRGRACSFLTLKFSEINVDNVF